MPRKSTPTSPHCSGEDRPRPGSLLPVRCAMTVCRSHTPSQADGSGGGRPLARQKPASHLYSSLTVQCSLAYGHRCPLAHVLGKLESSQFVASLMQPSKCGACSPPLDRACHDAVAFAEARSKDRDRRDCWDRRKIERLLHIDAAKIERRVVVIGRIFGNARDFELS